MHIPPWLWFSLGHCNKNRWFWNNHPVRRAAWPDLQTRPPGSEAGAEKPLGFRYLGVMVHRSIGDVDLREAPARPGSGGYRPGDGLIGAAGVDSMGHEMKEMGG